MTNSESAGLPFEKLKLTAIGCGTLNDLDFARRLDAAVTGSDKVRVAKGPLMIEDKRFQPSDPEPADDRSPSD